MVVYGAGNCPDLSDFLFLQDPVMSLLPMEVVHL